MKKFFTVFGKILFLVLEVICAVVSALLVVGTFCASASFAALGITHITVLLFISSILGVFNVFVTLYTFLKKEDD